MQAMAGGPKHIRFPQEEAPSECVRVQSNHQRMREDA